MTERLTQPVNRFREYETIYILRGDVNGETAQKIADRVVEVVSREQGHLLKVENWGRRRMAYAIAKQSRGVYTYVKFLGRGGLVAELERNLKLQDAVIRYQTIVLRDNLVVEKVEVDPEELKFAPLPDATPEELQDDSPEKLLGFIDSPDERRNSRREAAEGSDNTFGLEDDELEAAENFSSDGGKP